MNDLNLAEKRIVTVLYYAQKPLSTSNIANIQNYHGLQQKNIWIYFMKRNF